MEITKIGQAAAIGWRRRVADAVAPRVAARTPLSAEHARALIGVAFVALSVLYLVRTVRRVVSRS